MTRPSIVHYESILVTDHVVQIKFGASACPAIDVWRNMILWESHLTLYYVLQIEFDIVSFTVMKRGTITKSATVSRSCMSSDFPILIVLGFTCSTVLTNNSLNLLHLIVMIALLHLANAASFVLTIF